MMLYLIYFIFQYFTFFTMERSCLPHSCRIASNMDMYLVVNQRELGRVQLEFKVAVEE